MNEPKYGTKFCKDCKHFIWYSWWWPYFMGMAEVETREECHHEKNYKKTLNPKTGETHIDMEPSQSYSVINKNCDCRWFESGRYELNLDGKMSAKDISGYEEYMGNRIYNHLQELNKKWWQFWK